MNERLLEAINKLNDRIKDVENNINSELNYLREEISDTKNDLKDYKDKNNQLTIEAAARRLEHYHIKDDKWYYDEFDTGKLARGEKGVQGEPFRYEDFTKEQLKKLVGPQGETGNGIKEIVKVGEDGLIDNYSIYYTNGKKTSYKVKNGRDGMDGAPGKVGPQGEPGKDAEIPKFKIGKVEDSDMYGGASAKIRNSKKDNTVYIDLVLPRGPQGFTGFDGKPGRDGKGGIAPVIEEDMLWFVERTVAKVKEKELILDEYN